MQTSLRSWLVTGKPEVSIDPITWMSPESFAQRLLDDTAGAFDKLRHVADVEMVKSDAPTHAENGRLE